MMDAPPKNEVFTVVWKEKQYPCSSMQLNGLTVFVVGFTQRPLYLAKGTDTSGQPFWTSIPPDRKLSHVIKELGDQIDAHCAAQP